MRPVINLGDEVQDTITKCKGVVVCISNWLNGCQRVTLQPKQIKDNKPVDSSTFDAEQLVVLKSAKPLAVAMTGGPSISPVRSADPK